MNVKLNIVLDVVRNILEGVVDVKEVYIMNTLMNIDMLVKI